MNGFLSSSHAFHLDFTRPQEEKASFYENRRNFQGLYLQLLKFLRGLIMQAALVDRQPLQQKRGAPGDHIPGQLIEEFQMAENRIRTAECPEISLDELQLRV